jgi:hypothetical protein
MVDPRWHKLGSKCDENHNWQDLNAVHHKAHELATGWVQPMGVFQGQKHWTLGG